MAVADAGRGRVKCAAPSPLLCSTGRAESSVYCGESVSASSSRGSRTLAADADSPDYTDASARPVLHRSGEGPAHFTLPRPVSATAVKFYVSCSPDSRFRVTMNTWFSGPCSTAFENSGQLPLGPIGQPVTVDLDLPSGVHYWIVGLAVT